MDLESEIQRHGRELFEAIRGARPSAFSPRHVTGRLMQWAMKDERLKAELFRLVDVLPSLDSGREVERHMQEYLADSRKQLPLTMRFALGVGKFVPVLAKAGARIGVRQMAKQFIAAENPEQALKCFEQMRKEPLAFTADLLGEAVVSETEAEAYQAQYSRLLEVLSAKARGWREVPQIDKARGEALPRVNVSIKVSSMYSQLKPVDPEGAITVLSDRIRPILARAKELGAFINFDMESTACKEITIELFKRLLSEPELRDYPHFGIAIQAYLRASEEDLRRLIVWAQKIGRRFTVRLIKGAYWDYEKALAEQRSWRCPVFTRKNETDAQYEKLARMLLENRAIVDSALGSHNIRSISACLTHAEALHLLPGDYEFQMLYGMAEPIKRALIKQGHRLRDYAPIGEILPGMSYLVRRLLENSSNEGFLRTSFAEESSNEELLANPAQKNHRPGLGDDLRKAKPLEFRNEPLTDWTTADNRQRMEKAISQARSNLGCDHPLFIAGKELVTERWIKVFNPSRPTELIGRVSQAGIKEATIAMAEAERAFGKWRRTSVEERARLLERVAELLSRSRFELAALEIFESGKNWIESDADVAEAIDFCRFYAREMRRISERSINLAGESNLHTYIPMGIGVVIAPWNFPLAILCGMTVAGLVTGNCVIMKPAEQSSIVASRFARILMEAGFPSGTFAFLPGDGAEIGPFLVEHPKTRFVAFTGSRAVGTKIWESAAVVRPGQNHLKKVVCEMGGKNAIIIDSDADLDEAIPAILHSAFGYQGQKCSALSRLIVLDRIMEPLLTRLRQAVENLQIGYPENPGTVIGPLISQEAQQRVREYIAIGKKEAAVFFGGSLKAELQGWFVPPVIFTAVHPKARIAQEEIFGPVLSVFGVRDLDEAISLANNSPYALTGGIFSRSPGNIARATRELLAGNIYVNRAITGALVSRQPFGGFNMSGGGTKAGGPDYLLNFMYPKVITENTMRRGFAPADEEPGE
jgi:RHH-type proline utilization regulon transcriptional repressor/proline dehydrogenase/delta 1-pyrroline-5-carboxylate dehydrogenase